MFQPIRTLQIEFFRSRRIALDLITSFLINKEIQLNYDCYDELKFWSSICVVFQYKLQFMNSVTAIYA